MLAPDDPKAWLSRAQSSLELTERHSEKVHLEDLCFNAQQAVEKAIKGVLIKYKVKFPFTHNITDLLNLLHEVIDPLPEFMAQAAGLTSYAVVTRYPHLLPPVTEEDYDEAVRVATLVVQWAEDIILEEEE